MIYHLEAPTSLPWEYIKKVRFDEFKELKPERAYFGNKIKIPFDFSGIRILDNAEINYRFSIKEYTLYETIQLDNEIVETETPISDRQVKYFMEHFYKKFKIYWHGSFTGVTLEEIQKNLYFLEEKTNKYPEYRLDIGTYTRDFKIIAQVKLIDVKNRFKKLEQSQIILDCYEDDFVTVRFPRRLPNDTTTIDLQQKTFNIFLKTYEDHKMELLFNT